MTRDLSDNVRAHAGTQRAAMLARERHLAAGLDGAHTRATAGARDRATRLARATLAERDAAAARGERPVAAWLLQRDRLPAVRAELRAAVDAYAREAREMVLAAQRAAAEAGAGDARMLLPAWFKSAVPSERALLALVGRVASDGTPLGRLFTGWGAEASDRAARTLLGALMSGVNPRTVASQLANDLNISRNRALVIARTEMLGAYRDASLDTYRANSDVCTGWVWMASPGACDICADEDGGEHTLDESFSSHPNCRCSPAPLTRSYDDLLGGLFSGGDAGEGIDASDLEEAVS